MRLNGFSKVSTFRNEKVKTVRKGIVTNGLVHKLHMLEVTVTRATGVAQLLLGFLIANEKNRLQSVVKRLPQSKPR